MAMNILSLAPAARILDLPLLPPHIDNLLTFMSWAAEAMQQVLWDMEVLRIAANRVLPVVVCNAWSVYDTSTEPANQPNFRYSDNPTHDFNLTVAETDALRFDQVFAAGNCGQFCPDSRCGPNDIGPGRGILGANSHVAVLTVGAVRADGLWLGYSSQGPGQPDLGTNKPDLVAPSQFEEVQGLQLPEQRHVDFVRACRRRCGGFANRCGTGWPAACGTPWAAAKHRASTRHG